MKRYNKHSWNMHHRLIWDTRPTLAALICESSVSCTQSEREQGTKTTSPLCVDLQREPAHREHKAHEHCKKMHESFCPSVCRHSR